MFIKLAVAFFFLQPLLHRVDALLCTCYTEAEKQSRLPERRKGR